MKPAVRDVLRLSSESLLDFGLGTSTVHIACAAPRPMSSHKANKPTVVKVVVHESGLLMAS
jgi:hypothetical protein